MTVSDFGAAQAQGAIEYFVDACEIGRMLGIDHRTVQQMARDGVITAYPPGEDIRKTWRFLPSEVHDWMQRRVNSDGHPCRSNRRKPT